MLAVLRISKAKVLLPSIKPKANITRLGGAMKPRLRIHVGAKTRHHIEPRGEQGLRQELKLRKPQAVSSRSP